MKLPGFIPIVFPENLNIFLEAAEYFTHAIIPAYLITDENIQEIKDKIEKTEIEWILSSIMPDELLLTKTTLDNFLELADELNIDIVLAWDTPTYLGDDERVRRERMDNAIRVIKMLKDLGYTVIPLIKGASPNEVDGYTNKIYEMGHDIVAFHVSQYLTSDLRPTLFLDELYSDGRELMYGLIRRILEHNITQLLIVGGSGYNRINGFLRLDNRIILGGSSWYLDAKNYALYTPNKKEFIHRRHYLCNCPVCLNKKINELRRIRRIAIHNLLYTKNLIETLDLEYNIIIRDVILSREQDIAIVGPLRVGDENSIWRQMIKTIKKITPTYLILAGDIFTNQITQDSLKEWHDFLKQLKNLQKKTMIIPMKGILETRPYPLTARYEYLTATKLDPINMWKEKTEYDHLLLSIMRLLAGAKNSLTILKMTQEETVEIEILYEYPVDEYTPKEIHRYLSRRRKDNKTWIISTIYSTPTISKEYRVATTGAWHKKPYQYKTPKPSVIYVTKEGKIKQIQPEA